MVKSNTIKVNKTARYFTLGTLSEKTKTVWFVFHGYGQLANEFIKNFNGLENDSTFIVAPEAFNKFYLRGFSGKIGATWMTKEDRESEIEDYVEMIDTIFKNVFREINFPTININILGFSQGSQTAVRWLDKYKRKINNLILWEGPFPRDCEYNNDYWRNVNSQIVIGKQDKFISEEVLEKEIMYLKSQQINHNIIKFDGGHELDDKTLLMLSNIL